MFSSKVYNGWRRRFGKQATMEAIWYALPFEARNNFATGYGCVYHALSHAVSTGRISTPRHVMLHSLTGASAARMFADVWSHVQATGDNSVHNAKEALYAWLDKAGDGKLAAEWSKPRQAA